MHSSPIQKLKLLSLHSVVIYNVYGIKHIFVFQETVDWKSEWHPKIVFFNALEITKRQKNHYFRYEKGNPLPLAVETFRIRGTFRGNLKLEDFPLDYQVCFQ